MFFTDLLISAPIIAGVWLFAIILSITVHEFAHALVGRLKGDLTAEAMGRLTLNPIAHIDPVGLIPLILLGFGWAKPVPFNPYNLRNPRVDAVHIALAGPFSNLLLAVMSGIVLRFVGLDITNLLVIFLLMMILVNLFLFFFNLIPVHPLDGSKLIDALLIKPRHAQLRNAIATYGPQVLMVLVILSIFTSINIFFFISEPSFGICSAIAGAPCDILLSEIFY